MSDTLRDYLNQIGKIPLLSAAEEIELGHAIQKMMALERKDNYTKEEQRIIRIGTRAKRRMIQGNLRLVINVAKKYRHLTNRITIHDLVQEGNIGLIRAVELFDPERGYKFSTYAYWWIRQGIVRATQTQDRIIKLPSGAGDILRKVRTFMIEYAAENKMQPSIEQCAEFAGISPETMRDYMRNTHDVASLDTRARANDEESSSIIDLIANQDRSPEEDLATETKIEAVRQALHHMNEISRQVIILRFGLDGEKPCSKREIGRRLGIAQDTAKRMLDIAEREMRLILREGLPGKSQLQKRSFSLIWGWG